MSETSIRSAREESGLSQQYMARKLGVSRQAYAHMESNPDNIRIATARKICAILGREYERIFFNRIAS